MIGATTSQSLDLTLINKGDMVYGTSTIKVEIGLKIGSIIEYIPIGIYNIDDIEKTDYTIKITAFDNMIKFETPYFSTLGDTPTLQQVVNELSSKTGVQFIGNLPSYIVKKLEGFSCREILSYVASICGGNAAITRDGKFTIVTPKDNSYSIGTANYIDYKREETKYKIGKVSCQAGEEVLSKGSLGTDSMELQFENPWINATILTDIYNKLNGFEYLGYSMKWQGDISLDVGDIVTITDKKGVVRKHPILSQKLTYTGGLTSEISAKGENKNKNEFSSSGPSEKKVERVVMELALINKALIDVAYIGDLTANNIKFDTASGGTLDLQSLLVKFVSGENGQYLNLTSSNAVIDNAVIKDLIAPNISVGDLKAGNIDSNRFNIVGSSGNLLIKDNTIQIKDANRTRVQIGKDASNDYNMYVWDSTGKLMFDATGLKADGIKSKIIRDDMISDTANINGSKINISSLITEVNKDTNTQVIKASKIAFDSTGQSLEVSFNSLKSNVDSKESRNLFRNTTNEYKDIGIGQWFTPVSQRKHCNYYGLVAGDKITFSLDIKSTSNKPLRARVDFYSEETGDVGKTSYISTIIIPAGGEGKSYITAVIPNGKEYIQLMLSNGDTTIVTNTVEKYKCVKLEKGDNTNPVWTPAPEDIEEKIQANTTAITAVQGQIGILISDNTINKGNITTLQNNYTTIDATVNGLKTTVATHTTEISTAQNTADSKAKVFTSTPTTPYKIGDLWVQGTSGDVMKCKVARSSGSYVAADWEKASKYTDDTKANAVEVNLNNLSGKVTTVETKQATLEQNIEGFKTTVSSTYSTKTELNTLNDTVTVVEQKVNTVEQNITATAITTTISSAINAGTSSITTTKFTMNKDGLAIKNGGLTIKNKAGETVLSSDTNGNLTVTGTITGSKIVGSDITGGTINGSTIISEGLVSKRELFIEGGGGYSPQITFRPLIKNQDGTGTLKNKAYLYASSSGLHIQAVEDGDIIIEANRLLFFGGYSINTNGYSKLPNGLILQWGVFTTPGINANAEITPTITIPIAFPNRMLIVMPYVRKSVNASGGTVNVEVAIKQVTHYTLSTFAPRLLAKAYVEGGVELGYIAIGY